MRLIFAVRSARPSVRLIREHARAPYLGDDRFVCRRRWSGRYLVSLPLPAWTAPLPIREESAEPGSLPMVASDMVAATRPSRSFFTDGVCIPPQQQRTSHLHSKRINPKSKVKKSKEKTSPPDGRDVDRPAASQRIDNASTTQPQTPDCPLGCTNSLRLLR